MKKTNFIRLLVLMMVLITSISQLWAGNNITYQDCHFYFNPYYDATNTMNKGYIQMAARKYQNTGGDDYGWYTAVTTLNTVANTRLYYTSSLEGTGWGDEGKQFHGWAIISNSTAKSNGETEYWSGSNSTWYSDFKAYGLNSGNTYLFQASSSTKGQTIETTSAPGYLSSGWSALNKTITVKAKISTNNGSSYSEATSPASLTASSKKFTAHNTCTTTTSLSSGSIICGYTATTTLTAPSTDPAGYTWVGWYNSSGTQETTGKTLTIYPTSNATYYAYYKANRYNGTINTNGGDANGSYTATYSTTSLTSVSAPTRTGYYVTGYYDDAEGSHLVATSAGVLQKNVTGFTDANGKWNATSAPTIFPQWDNHYTVTFDQHDPSFEGTENVTATYGSAMPAITVPSKSGYTFGGYFTGTNGSGTQYYNENGTSENNWAIASNTTLHAKWTGISYQVAFDANEGTGSMANEDFTYGAASKALTTNTYTRSGYYFLGWNTSADGSGTKYYNGKPVQNLTTADGGIVTLYAQWAKTYTLYFIQAGCSWGAFYAKSEISYDGQTYYPKGSGNGTAMTNVATGIYMTNFTYNSSHNFGLYKIEGIPEGSQIKFSNNGSDPKGNMSWSAEKPYYLYGNNTWYALDRGANQADIDTISTATNMCVYLVEHAKDYGIDQCNDGQYAIIELSANTNYQFKYRNWLSNTWSGCTATGDGAYIIKGDDADGISAQWSLNGGNNAYLQTSVAGEYKFLLNGWTNNAPNAKIYFPVGVSLTESPSEALAGATTTVRLTAAAAKTYLKPFTYYYQISTDNGSTWTTIAETTNTTYDYTFAAQKCKFRVILKNSAGLRSKSSELSFTTYSTKSFYVYNPYNNSTNKWRWLHLYTWDSNDNNRTYNGSWPGGWIHCTDPQGTTGTDCVNGNDIKAMGGNWFYVTIDERANCFMLVGEDPYNSHQTVTCYVSNYIADGKYMINTESNQNKVVAYQAKGASDYRLKYTYGSPAKYRYSPIYNTTLDGTTVTTSMWMNADNGTSLTIQQGTGNNTWADRKTYTNSSNGFGGLVDSDHRDHGYVFTMNVNFNTGTPASSTISDVSLYNGSFYVRTDGLDGGWNVYEKEDHTMHNNAASLTSGSPAYDYYLCKWIGSAGTNVKFTVANDYNPELVESLAGDVNASDPLYNRQTLPTPTNVRFSWNSQTNTLTRAYLSGSTDASSRFLVLIETSDTKGKIYREDGKVPTGDDKISGLNNYELLFSDMGNWVYQIIVQANPGAKAKVTAKYNSQEAEFIPSTTLIGGSGSSKYTYRIVYDYKNNILTNAWVANGDAINSAIELNTNVMLVRRGQNAATQINFGEGGSLSQAKKLIGVIEFDKTAMVGQMGSWNSTAYANCLYYISFPFDVSVNDIFGVGTRGVDWRIQKYNGAKRAEIGWFAGDGTTTFWEDLPADSIMHAYEGYCLMLNRSSFNNGSNAVWENITRFNYLYFPSITSSQGTISTDDYTLKVPKHECKINRYFTQDINSDGSLKPNARNHIYTDSHWNMIGVPLLNNETGDFSEYFVEEKDYENNGFHYLYEWNSSDNTLGITAAGDFTFKSMNAYMVQFFGDITFTGSVIAPASVAARTLPETKRYRLKLELEKDGALVGRTFVELAHNAVDSFMLNEDVYMMKNSSAANIYTFAGCYEVGANVMSVGNHTIPVGIEVKSAGTYTFTMPSVFSGTVTLVDTYAQTRTDLSIEDYQVDLSKGTITDRFYLELNINEVVTSMENTEGNNVLNDGGCHKFVRNDQMFILRDGVTYDAQGRKVE